MLRQRAHVNSEFLGHLRHRAAIPQRRHECLPNGLVINRLASLPGTHWLHATCALRSMKAALKEIRQLKFLDGAKELELANEILPHPNVQFNVARAYAEAGMIERAIEEYKKYLAGDPADRGGASRIIKLRFNRLTVKPSTKNSKTTLKSGTKKTLLKSTSQ